MTDTTATSRLYSTRYSSQVAVSLVPRLGCSLLFSTEQNNADKRRLDRERCLSHPGPVASLGESWDRDPGALSGCLRSLSLGVSI